MARSTQTPARKYGYQDVAELLREDVREAVFSAGSLLPTEKELQERFHVSRTTVRRALQALIDSGWAEASPNRGVIAKRGKLATKTTNVAYIDHTDTVNQVLFLQTNRHLQDLGLHLVHVDSRTHGVEGALRFAKEEGFAAAIVWPKKGYLNLDEVGDTFKQMPVICVQHEFPNITQADLVTEDHLMGGWLAASHLSRLGRKQIAITGMMDMLRTNHLRFSGYLLGQFHESVQPDAKNFLFCYTSNQAEPYMGHLERRLRDNDRPDALFVMDDFLMPYVVQTIEDAGLRVPEDIAIVAFGNDVPFTFGKRRLTTIDMDWSQVAGEVAERVRLRLEGDDRPPVTIRLGVNLVVRGSCGAPEEEWCVRPFSSHANSLAFARPNKQAAEFGERFESFFSNTSTVTNGGTRYE